MTPRQRVGIALAGGSPDQVPYHDSFWATTLARWRNEGLPAGVGADEYFGCQIARVGGDYSLQLPVRVLQETARYRVYVDANGATRRDMITGDGWTPQWLDFTIKGPDDWRRLEERARYHPSRLPAGVADLCRAARARDRFVAYSAHACFHPTWQKLGMENLMMWMVEDPEWVGQMFAAHTQLIIDLYEAFQAAGAAFDGAFLSDDLGYRNAPLISPRMYREQVLPHHRRACERFAQDGLKTILHSDGQVGPLIPHFLEAGFAALHPLEAKAGLDVRQLKSQYQGRLALFGNIDVRRLAAGPDEAEEEVRVKVTAAKEGGGYLFHSDHSVPSDVPLANYRAALAALARYGSYE